MSGRVRQPLYPVDLMPKSAVLTKELGGFCITNSCFLHFFFMEKVFYEQSFLLCTLLLEGMFLKYSLDVFWFVCVFNL